MSGHELLENGWVIAINHEPLSFLRRAGYAGADQESRYLDDHREENIRRLAANGCDMVRMHFYKGFGIEAEKEEMELTREFVRTCHACGVKVELYVQLGTLQYETLLAERPDMMSWVQTDEDGKPITLVYGHQTFRHYPCFNREGYWSYLERVIRMGIKEFQADALGFDNISTGEEPFACRCESCRKAFVGFLKGKYRPDTAEGARLTKERFGHTILDFVRPPAWNYFNHPWNLTAIRDPVLQEWILFRCESLHRTLKRLYDYCKALDPDVLLEFNTYKQFGTNTAFVHGIYVPDLADCIDVYWNECDPFPGFTPDGRLLHKVRGYKLGRSMGKAVFTNHPSSASEEGKLLAYGESMAFNRGLVNGVGPAEAIYSGRETAFRRYKEFGREHPDFYHALPCANVALYESKPSLSYHTTRSVYADLTMQQGLLRGHVPYDVVLSLDCLASYRVLVLPAVECLADAEIRDIVAFVRTGGGLLLTDESGEYDEWRRRRGPASLACTLGLASASGEGARRAECGSGRIVHVPLFRSELVFDAEALCFRPFDVNQPALGLEYWRAPCGLDALMADLRWVSGDSLPVEVEAPEHVVIELQRSADGSSLYLHVLNYRPATPIEGLRLRFTGGFAGAIGGLRCCSPDGSQEAILEPEADGWIALPVLRCYTVVCAAVNGTK